ncbi:hypothetical protein BGX38DRAFT_1221963 [Terfezia claveryi]|nr:hypothetical protein BGX38DRAFT_1221963 [Terfezia claveryi]
MIYKGIALRGRPRVNSINVHMYISLPEQFRKTFISCGMHFACSTSCHVMHGRGQALGQLPALEIYGKGNCSPALLARTSVLLHIEAEVLRRIAFTVSYAVIPVLINQSQVHSHAYRAGHGHALRAYTQDWSTVPKKPICEGFNYAVRIVYIHVHMY